VGYIEAPEEALVLDRDPSGLRSFGTAFDVDDYGLTLTQGPEAAAINCGKVYENVIATIGRGDKPETLGLVKPLDGI
jgi:hypothetical protein